MPSKVSPYGRGARARQCRECGARRDEGAEISARGLCLDCGKQRSNDAADQISRREGPHFDEWRRSMVEHAHRLITQ